MKRAVLALALAVPLALAPSAQAQGTSSLLFGFGGPSVAKFVSAATIPIRVRGEVVVSFHGDPATGCAAAGLCVYSGTVVVRPQSGALLIETYRLHRRIGHVVGLILQPSESQYMTASHVVRSIPGQADGVCADAAVNSFDGLATSVHGRSLSIGLFTRVGNILSTRCAGPLDADLAGVGSPVPIPLKRAERGRLTVDLSGTHSFASHGFAGTVSSTLVLTLRKPSRNQAESTFPPGTKTRRMRTVNERLRLIRVSGHLSAAVRGSSVPVACQVLDSCGLLGTLGFDHVAKDVIAEVSVTGRASRPYRDFLAALGLATGQPRGLSPALSGSWILGPVTEALTQPEVCSDSAAGGQMFLTMPLRGAVLRGFGGWAGARTRCPGPNVGNQNPLLSAALPLSALRRRTFTITLRPAGTLVDDGYTASLHGHLTLTFRRGRITQQVFAEPAG